MKIALCTPCHMHAEMRFAVDWVRLALHTSKAVGAEIEVFTTVGSHVSTARNMLAAMALQWGADWVLWIDADQTFPPDTLVTLLSRDKPIIAANCTRRLRPTGPTAYRHTSNGPEYVWTTRELAESDTVEEVSGIGMGLCLTRASVLAKLDKPLFAGAKEDAFFFDRARKAGFPIFIDHRASLNVGHIYLDVTTHDMAAFDRRAFEAVNSTPPPGS